MTQYRASDNQSWHGGPRWALAVLGIVAAGLLQACGGSSEDGEDPGDGDGGAGSGVLQTCLSQESTFVNNSLQLADIVNGGQLYDKFWTISQAGTEPQADHPLWDTRDGTVNTATGSDTWRCKECHGWDYAGVDGAYGDPSSSHYTGFPGLLAAADKPAAEVFCSILAGTSAAGAEHSFADHLSRIEVLDLTRFITEGVVDTSQWINSDKSVVNGDVTNGATLYSDDGLGCAGASCHGPNGDLPPEMADEPLGELATDNPWEVMHKIRFGHPASTMPAYQANIDRGTLTMEGVADVAAYAKSLAGGGGDGGDGGVPAGNAEVIAFGGRLFDNHWSERGVATDNVPTHQLFTIQTTNTRTGSETWRCKECHGWDYAGVDGAYGNTSNSHYTGFPGILGAVDKLTPDQLFDYLKFGFARAGLGTVHAFGSDRFGNPLISGGPGMSDEEINALVAFVLDGGVIDTTPYIRNITGGGAIGDLENGRSLYLGDAECSRCHGPQGDQIDFEDDNPSQPPNEFLGDLALENPWETLHKIRAGQPGQSGDPDPMPSSIVKGLSTQDAADIVRYASGDDLTRNNQ